MSCGIGRRFGSDLTLLWLWLWCRLAAAAPIQPLAWEIPYATGAALKRKSKKKKKKEFEDGNSKALNQAGAMPRSHAREAGLPVGSAETGGPLAALSQCIP